jgi:CubicO group peptidase (beta-lactamase class C family)
VTSREGGQPEADPRAVGLDETAPDRIWAEVVRQYETGLYPAISLCVRRRGRVVLDRAIGHARGNSIGDAPGTPVEQATPQTLFNLFSATKMVTAMLIHMLDERRLLHLDDPVARFLPAFQEQGKQRITLRHVLTHRAGIPNIPSEETDIALLKRPEEIVERLRNLRPTWRPGRRLAYHALTGGFVLGEVIRTVTGRDVRQFLQDEVCDRIGLRQFNYGVPAEDIPRVAVNSETGPPVRPPFATLFKNALGVDYATAVEKSNDPRFLTAIVPAGNIICAAHEGSRFMELLLRGGELDGQRIFERRTVARAIAEQSYHEVDLTLGLPFRYAMGFMLGSRYLSLFGPGTPRAFGHLGFTSVVVYADLERDVSVCFLQNGKPFLTPKLARWYQVMHTIAQVCPRDAEPFRGW